MIQDSSAPNKRGKKKELSVHVEQLRLLIPTLPAQALAMLGLSCRLKPSYRQAPGDLKKKVNFSQKKEKMISRNL